MIEIPIARPKVCTESDRLSVAEIADLKKTQ